MKLDPWSYAASTRSEHAEQVALFMWANMAGNFGLTAANDARSYIVAGHAQTLRSLHNDCVPQLEWMHAIHNQGHGDAIRGAKAKREGVKAGVYDVFLPVPMPGDDHRPGVPQFLPCGLYVELKLKDGGRVSDDQSRFGKYANAVGYLAEVCHGWELARDVIVRYLGLPT